MPGYQYCIEFIDSNPADPASWVPFLNQDNGAGTWIGTAPVDSLHTFTDDFSSATSGSSSSQRFYRVRVTRP